MALKDITLGQYFPGNSLIHRLDPRSKLIFTVLFIVAIFLCKHLVSYGLVLAVLLILIGIWLSMITNYYLWELKLQ